MRRFVILCIVVILSVFAAWPWLPGGSAQPSGVALVYLPCVYGPQPTPTPIPVPGDVPILLTPTDGSPITTAAPELVWLADGTHWYAIHIATDAQFSEVAATVSPRSYLDGPEHRTVLLVNLPHTSQYFWRVGYETEPGTYVWSAVESFVISESGDLPAAPQLLWPESCSVVSSNRPRLIWEQLSGADMYLVTVGVNGNSFTNVVLSPLSELVMPFPLLPGRTYAWRVRARNASGWGGDSEPWLFTTPAN